MTTLKMDGKFGSNRLDREDQGVLGKPVDRLDGVRKVTGGAVYSADWRSDQPLAVGYLVCSTRGTGRVTALDVKLARQAPGVLAIYPRLPGLPATAPAGDLIYPQPAEVRHVGAPLALVVAETFEQARAAAILVKVAYDGDVPGRYILGDERARARKPGPFLFEPDHLRGSKKGLSGDTAAVDVEFTTPPQTHAAMEPHATIASWEGDKVTLRASYQMLNRGRQALARVLGIAEDRIRLISTFVGGGFGGKTGMSVETVFAAQASRLLGRPVKVVMTRRQVFAATSRRSETIQRISLVARAGKGLAEIGHHSIVANLPHEIFWEPPGVGTMNLYASDSLDITHRLAEIDLVRAGMMRAPGEAVGMLALEVAMDELAEKLGKDPVAFRIECEPVVDPLDGKPFSARNLVGCLKEGARRFGWDRRQTQPGQRRDGEWLVGMGMAAAIRLNIFDSSQARVRLSADGTVRVETDLTDIGTGSYTVMAQVASEMLGVPMDRVTVALGDTDLPLSAGSGGSWGASTTGTAVFIACQDIAARIAAGLGVEPDAMTLKDGQVIAANKTYALASLVPPRGLEALGHAEPGANYQTHVHSTFGAHFVEAAVSALTGEVRVRRMLGVFDAGRIMNAKLARSQLIGGMIFGIGGALGEELVVDPRYGNFINGDLGDYLIPVNADVPPIDVVFLDEQDAWANPLKTKGIGELGISGSGAAIANAIYHACGARCRDFPLTPDKVFAAMEHAAGV